MELKDDLRQRIAAGRVVVVVGTGVSVAASGGNPVASWKGLLESGIERCEGLRLDLSDGWAERQRAALEHGDTTEWLGVASQVQAKLEETAAGEFRRWLDETVGCLEIVDRRVPEAIQALRVPVATTNYDRLLADVFQVDPITWRDVPRMEQVLQSDHRTIPPQGPRGILHLHGFFDDPKSVILDFRSYERVLGAADAQHIQQLLRSQFTLLFIGYGAGFDDPNFSHWMKWGRETFRGQELHRHYRLCLKKDLKKVRGQHVGEDRIFVLPYGEDHEELAEYLHGLAPEKNSVPEPGPAHSPSTLPAPPAWFLDRDDEVEELVEHLTSDEPAPVPILGGPGMGKTALSLEVAHDTRVGAVYGERRYFVRCDAVADLEALPGAIAQALDFRPQGDPWKAVLDELARERALLILDNFETPWEPDKPAAEEALSTLAHLHCVALVVSVRGKERPNGPGWRQSFEMERLSLEATKTLFGNITDQKFAQDPKLEEVLALPDGMPLAIRLLASAAQPQPNLSWLLDAWRKESTAILARGDGKDANLDTSIAISFQGRRLDDAARDLAARCALLPDGVAFEDLQAVAESQNVQQAAANLRASGLAYYDLHQSRLRFLAPVREAIQRLAPLEGKSQEIVVIHYLGLVEKLGPAIGGEGGDEAARRLEPEIGNLDQAFKLALSSTQTKLAFTAAYGLCELIRFRGVGSSKTLERVALTAKQQGEAKAKARLTFALGLIALDRSQHDEARDLFQKAQPLYEKVGSLPGQANCIANLGVVALRRSQHDEARELFKQAQPLYEKVGDLLGQANCIRSLGDIALRRSQSDEARDLYREAQPLYEKVGNLLGQANCIKGLGNIARARSQFDEARDLYREAQPLFERVGDLLGQANGIQSLGDIALDRSQHDEARDLFQKARPLYEKVGDLLGKANCIQSLGDIAFAEGDRPLALKHWNDALELYRRIPEPYSIGWTLKRLAESTDSAEERCSLAREAHEAWLSIDRPDLVKKLAPLLEDCPE